MSYPLNSSPGEEPISLGGYKGKARELLDQNGAVVGKRVTIKTADGLELTGIVVPRYEHSDSEHIVIKLKSGYNTGVDVNKIASLSVVTTGEVAQHVFGKTASQQPSKEHSEIGRNLRHLLLLSTGGTIASRVDYRTGAVYPALSADDLYSAVPELGSIASIEPEVVFSTYSENLAPPHWQRLAERIKKTTAEVTVTKTQPNLVPDGIVVMLGTDTLGYVAAALSFALLGLEIPVVCVGAQRSSDRPSSDAALNLKAAARFAANSNLPGVYVSMHATENDDFVAIHSGVRVRKNHTSRRDAYQSIDTPCIAKANGSEVKMLNPPRKRVDDGSFNLKTNFDSAVALLKFYPGFDLGAIDYYTKTARLKGLVIEGTGLGHVSSNIISKLADAVKNGVFVGMTSQCIWGHVDLDVYETGRDLQAAGVVPLGNMFGETAYAKLSWTLGNFERSRVNEIMLTNFVGEFTERIPLANSDN